MNENPPAKAGDKSPAGKFYSSKLFWPAALVLGGVLFLGLDYLAEVFTHESTDDAFIAGHIVSIAPRVAGQVAAVHIRDNQLVRSNDLLVKLDPADFALTVAQKEAAVASQAANVQTLVAAVELMRAKVATAAASARKAKADTDADEATAQKTQADFTRAQDLVKQKTISQQEFDAALAASNKAQADLKSARENATEEESKVDEAEKQLMAVITEKEMVFSQFNEAQTNVAVAKLNLSYTKIFAPGDGRVTRKAVEVGDYLQAGQQIMSLVPLEVWVQANFKESQLKDMQPGQPAMVGIDALGGKEFRAHVDSIQAGSGAAFSLLPPENASGNFVKVVQRVPVKIVFDEPLPAGKVLGPGLSVVPSVQVSKFTLPVWTIVLFAMILDATVVFTFRHFAGRKTDDA